MLTPSPIDRGYKSRPLPRYGIIHAPPTAPTTMATVTTYPNLFTEDTAERMLLGEPKAQPWGKSMSVNGIHGMHTLAQDLPADWGGRAALLDTVRTMPHITKVHEPEKGAKKSGGGRASTEHIIQLGVPAGTPLNSALLKVRDSIIQHAREHGEALFPEKSWASEKSSVGPSTSSSSSSGSTSSSSVSGS